MKKNYRKIIILALLITHCIGLGKICSAEITNNPIQNNASNKDRLENIKEKGGVTVLTTDLPPFSFLDTKTNKETGIYIDIINNIAEQLGVKTEFKVVPFSDLVETLNTDDSIDVIVTGLTIIDERKKLVSFTEPLSKSSEVIVTPKVSSINFKEDLKNVVVGVQRGTVHVNYAEDWKREGKIKDYILFDSISQLLSAVNTGKIAAAIADSTVTDYTIRRDNLYLKIIKPYTPEYPKFVAIAVRKSDISLLNELNKLINNMKNFKVIDKIFEKYGLDDEYSVGKGQ
ncbi:polar amino acid transport system substrate-binding protein [Clostridium saccharoperbutylacetonicum]|uniref:Extracellular solute-binding protein, family 3 n=1 Tax=Clostridium saccharoperbutylacetonicum N1-4(HMT) TaxID=931276 RepID=M1MCT3_9CLOT|nr:ABC transporter substrate-binding protein [Clostridium saccharoperbutylacetonicum]AGF55709.1 extracellular solute-binding protein, family 3 [Clostridium saccharoperbutylacetonicum N1-4(HMT)]NRT63562.1 polar amino acid transport system substrate-binding protein [Clostridium saccharoperbutylacetonicum]NSB26925.1 polar amino acid transport system substrate-binding protein [Clostridium saccharoperbutylacetonicum]NSB40409.1 polar amino acid transport system substrate-binding protein [Clostridium 